MSNKRVTIYQLAKVLGISASYVSRALNNHPSVSSKTVELVKKKAAELNYKHNSHAANLRQGSSKTMGVIVPHINQSFFSEAIAGIEEICFKNNHSLIICQSHENFKQESLAIETLIHQNVDCILISISAETQSAKYLHEIIHNDIHLIQFDRCLDSVDSYKVVNDNEDASYNAVKNLVTGGYRRIAFLGGPEHITIFRQRKDGYLKAIKEADLDIPYHFIADNRLSREKTEEAAMEMLNRKDPPDAFFTVSDHQALCVLQVAKSMGIAVPEQLGLFGFANEAFAEMIKPALSSVNQKSKELGKSAANHYFQHLLTGNTEPGVMVIKSEIIVRQSSVKHQHETLPSV